MVAYAEDRLRAVGYKPYYLYRQKYMSGSFENVGWSRDGRDCLYNIYMMEETHTILSLGGGGMTKVNLPDGHLTRFHNPKFPEQYIEQIDSVLAAEKGDFRAAGFSGSLKAGDRLIFSGFISPKGIAYFGYFHYQRHRP